MQILTVTWKRTVEWENFVLTCQLRLRKNGKPLLEAPNSSTATTKRGALAGVKLALSASGSDNIWALLTPFTL